MTSPTSNTSEPATAERTPSMMERMKFRRRSVDNQSTAKRSSKDQQANTSANIAATSSTGGAESTLYSSGDWSDVTVACKNHVWHLHKEILTSRCDHFRDKCMTEQARTPAGQPITIRMNDEDPSIVEAFLRYLYTGDMDWTHTDQQLHPYHFYSLVFKLAVRYRLPRLAMLALEPIELSDISRIDEELQEAVPVLYGKGLGNEDEMRELREVLVRKTALPWGRGMIGYASYKELIREVPDYTLDTIAYLAKEGGAKPDGELTLPIPNGPPGGSI